MKDCSESFGIKEGDPYGQQFVKVGRRTNTYTLTLSKAADSYVPNKRVIELQLP